MNPKTDFDILIVDDNLLEAELVSVSLRQAFPDCHIVSQTNGPAAVELCAATKFDCVFIDYNMPVMDGLELGRLLSRSAPHTPLILMTAVGDEMLVASALRIGFTDYIPKHRISKDSAERAVSRSMRAAEQARIIAEQREELEQFAHTLAHDFKQPIRQIRIFADMVAEELEVETGTEAARHLGYLSTAASRLGALVDVMSQYTLLSKTPELSVVDLAAVVENVRDGLAGLIEERKGVFISEALGSVYGNEALLTQVLQNLVANGLRYNTSNSPHVTVRMDAGADGKRLLSVRDNGIGIESKYLSEIFRPLARLHTAAEYPGSGLGLTIARKAVLALGGTIWCSSEPGAGSTFHVELLASASAAIEPEKAA